MSDRPEWWSHDPHQRYGPCDGFVNGSCSECRRIIWQQDQWLKQCDAAWREERQKVRDLKAKS